MSDYELGRHEAMISQLLADQTQMKADIAEIKQILAERAGERRATVKMASVLGAVVGALFAITAKWVEAWIRGHTG